MRYLLIFITTLLWFSNGDGYTLEHFGNRIQVNLLLHYSNRRLLCGWIADNALQLSGLEFYIAYYRCLLGNHVAKLEKSTSLFKIPY